MKTKSLEIPEILEIQNFIARDQRGIFLKTFNRNDFIAQNLEVCFRESYYSLSKKNVIRGMHFQKPPFDHNKLVHVTSGEILDVIVDLRNGSKTFGQHVSIKIKEFENSIYIPKGFAHGFLCLSNHATVVYNVSTEYKPEADYGVLWNSFGCDWEGLKNPIISERDLSLPHFNDFISPF